MGSYRKDFAGWAKVAEMVERRERAEFYKSGVIYWANLGVNIGSGEDGKGERFTRPVLLLAMLNKTQVLVIPITSQKKKGANYREIVVNGKVEYLLFDQLRTIDVKCLEEVVDEIDSDTLRMVRGGLLKILKRQFYGVN
jgi:mRNA interferase MazF